MSFVPDFVHLHPIVPDALGEWFRDTPWVRTKGNRYVTTYSRHSVTAYDDRHQKVQVLLKRLDLLSPDANLKIRAELRRGNFIERNEWYRHPSYRRRWR